MGCRVVVSSRPEGVRLSRFPEYARQFVVVDLKRLTSEQQMRCVRTQLKDTDNSGLVERLLQMSKTRQKLDEAYNHVCARSRAKYTLWIEEHLKDCPNYFLAAAGSPSRSGAVPVCYYNGDMRQRVVDGSRFVAELKDGAAPQSGFLKRLRAGLEYGKDGKKLLDRLDEEIERLKFSYEEKSAECHRERARRLVLRFREECGGTVPHERGCPGACGYGGSDCICCGGEYADNIAVNLMALSLKWCELPDAVLRKVLPSVVWRKVEAQTDEIYRVTEVAPPEMLQAVVRAVAHNAGVRVLDFAGDKKAKVQAAAFGGGSGCCYLLAPHRPKDPVRVFEKSCDDYAHRKFRSGGDCDSGDHDGAAVCPTACVADVLRCTVVCYTMENLAEILYRLIHGVPTTVTTRSGTRDVDLKFVRLKNKFEESQLDATRLRYVCLLYTSPSPRDRG